MEWFTSLPIDLAIFFGIAIFATAVLLLQLALMIFGLDHAFGVEDLAAGDGMGIISVRSVTGFFGGLGWTGVIALRKGLSVPVATLMGTLVGVVLMLSVAMFMKLIYSLRESGTLDYNNAIGQVGTVYIAIPASQQGPGKVRVLVQGRVTIIAAFTESDKKIATQQKVKVVGLIDERTLLVEPLSAGKSSSGEKGAES
jgi:hypothetical protein